MVGGGPCGWSARAGRAPVCYVGRIGERSKPAYRRARSRDRPAPVVRWRCDMTLRAGTLGTRGILLIIAVVCFALAAIGIDLGRINVTDIGLAFFAGAFLVR